MPLLGCILDKHGVRPDVEEIKAIAGWPVPIDIKGLRMFLGLAAYLRIYSRSYAELNVRLSRLFERTKKGHGTLVVSFTLKVSRRS